MFIHRVTYLSLFALVGCGLFGDNQMDIVIRTDADRYTATEETVVSLTVSNKSQYPIYYVCTGQIYLQELDGDRITKQWMIHGFEECLSSVPIPAGQKKVFELGFDKKSPLGNLTDAAFDESVKYRMTVSLFQNESRQKALSKDAQRSNTFQILRNPVM